jgi:hypothetical protein
MTANQETTPTTSPVVTAFGSPATPLIAVPIVPNIIEKAAK